VRPGRTPLGRSIAWAGRESCFDELRRYFSPRLRFFTAPCVSRRSPLLNGKGSSSKHRPDCFGPFRVRADLGASRFGPVYLGRDPSTNTRVIIRTFELSKKWRELGEQSDLLDSFRKLCETTLNHPSLARPLAFGAEGDIPYVVYADLAGTAMDAVMRQDGVRPVEEVLQRTRQLGDAIDFAAKAGVHHGMMAPCDVILEGERTGVTGFGLAQALIKVGIPAEAGSPYGSPQRLAGAPPTLADDIYSLAAITLELLIGTPADPDEETSRALREAGLPERRRIQRPAAHETREFTRIAGVDAGKLRASFAAAFSEDPSQRPSTASEFAASFQDAISNRGGSDKPAPRVVAVPLVSDEHEDPPSAPVLDVKRAEEGVTRELPSRQERVVAERRETPAMSQPVIQESHEDALREFMPESRVARPALIVDDALLAEVTPPRASSIDEASYGIPVQLGARPFFVAAVVAVIFAAGFGGGFLVGQRSRPSTASIDVNHHESVAEPQPTRAAVEDPKPIASTRQTVAPISEEKVSSSAPIAATTKMVAPVSNERASTKPITATVARQPAVPAVDSGRLLVRSTPAGAGVVVDGRSRGVTPLDLRELAFATYTIKVSHPGHDARQQRVTLSERRPARSVDFELRPTSVPSDETPAANSPGSLRVTSRPSGAQVFVDDNLISTTPFQLSNVGVGVRHLRIELSGYKTWTTSVQIEPSTRSQVSAILEPLEP
jgi:serine/threonine protein kinase